MKDVFIAAWNSFNEICAKEPDINPDKDLQNNFVEKCVSLYEQFVKKHMKEPSMKLDRHKVGAIIAIIGSSDDYVKYSKNLENDVFFVGKYTIPLQVGLSVVEQDMNNDLHRFKIVRKNKYISLYIPQPAICNTDYIDSLMRTLYYEQESGTDNLTRILNLANTFFLMEECTLLKNKINIRKWLKAKKQDSGIN